MSETLSNVLSLFIGGLLGLSIGYLSLRRHLRSERRSRERVAMWRRLVGWEMWEKQEQERLSKVAGHDAKEEQR